MKKLFFGFIAMVKSAFEGSKKSFALGASVIALAVLVSAYTGAKKNMEESLALVSFMPILQESLDDPENWKESDPGNCEEGPEVCKITFDTDRYPIENDELPQDVLDEVLLDNGATPHGQLIGTSGIVIFKKN